MELRPGYKKTEVGVIPEEWEVRKLKDVASFRTGPFGSALHKSDYTDDGVPIINPMHIVDGQLVPTRTMTVTENAAKNLADFRLKPGDVIIGRRGDMGRCAVVQGSQIGWLCGTGSLIIRSVGSDPNFLQRVLSSAKVVSAIEDTSVGSTMINLNQSTLGGLSIQFPPLPEQGVIAAALSDVDALLAKLDQLIAKKRDIKQATMQQLLTGKKRLSGFSGVWEVKRLGEIAQLYQPVTISQADLKDDGYIVYGANGIIGRYDKYNHETWQTIITCRGSTCGTVSKTVEKVWITGNAMVINCDANKDIDKLFLFHLLSGQDFSVCITGSGQPQIVRSPLFEYSLKLPPTLDEQTAIATVLSDMDAEIAALEARRDKTRDLKQGMMQELLTGRIRLVGGKA